LHDLIENNADIAWSEDEVSIEYKQYDLPEVFNQLVDFQNSTRYKITVNAPDIHCSSCVQLLEDLPEVNSLILSSRVNFEERKISFLVDKNYPLSALAMLLDKLGYPPQFNVSKKSEEKQKKHQKEILRKVAVAGFCFGNSMMFSMPHYFGLTLGAETFFASLFRYLNVALSVLVLAYPARDYFVTAFQALKHRKNHIDIPIVLGIVAIWGWSMYEIIGGIGFGYLDSLAGLIFFLLVGKWYQNKVYGKITFERSLHDFLPMSVRKVSGDEVNWVRVTDLEPGDAVSVKHGEVIPVNGVLNDGEGLVDYSFVTGESQPEKVAVGDAIFIGGKQTSGGIEVTIQEKQDIDKIWSAWKTPKENEAVSSNWIEKVSTYFTPFVLIVATLSLAYWMYFDPSKALFVFSAVLIVACPCALALSSPFTFGSIVRALGKNALFMKSSDRIETLSEVDHIIFDKTGTLTITDEVSIKTPVYHLDHKEEAYVRSVTSQSNHPLSQLIAEYLEHAAFIAPESYEEIEGKGIEAMVNGQHIRLGSELFITHRAKKQETAVYVEINGEIKAQFVFGNLYREDLDQLFHALGKDYKISVLSGDNDGELAGLRKLYPSFNVLSFNNSPLHKKEFIDECHANGDTTLMIGDGLNDQVALNQSDIGLAVADNINGFYPSSDGILVADAFDKLPRLLSLSKYSKRVLKSSLAFSVFYNLIGIAFAVAGSLTPIVAAILMPLSSITVVGLVTALVSLKAKKLELI
jgi:Cu+-exporting ATPase